MREPLSRAWAQERLVAFAAPALGAVVFGLAVLVLRRELAGYHLADVAGHFASIPSGRVALAVLLTIASYALLTGYDALAFRWIRNPLAYRRIALASFLGFVFSHNVGLSFLGGSAVRYRLLSSWGVPAGEIARVIAFNVLTFWLGFLALGAVLVLAPLPVPGALHAPFATSRPVGIALLLALASYLLASALRRAPLRVAGLAMPLPRLPTSAAQIALSSVDWALAALCFYVLLPEAQAPSFAVVLGAYLLAQVIGLASHVPGGLGVFEGALVWLLSPWLSGEIVLGSAIAYRIAYYLAPLAVGVAVLGAFEAMQRRRLLARAHSLLVRWVPEVVPRAFAAATLCAGLVLLLSGATPAGPGRVAAIGWLPLIELSHLLASLIGVALLLLARALQQRIDVAWVASLVLLAAGALASLAKGLDWEEASVLLGLFLALLPCRSFFYRRSSLVGQSFAPDWIVGIALALAGTAAVRRSPTSTSSTPTSSGGSSSSTPTRRARCGRCSARAQCSPRSRWRGSCGRRRRAPCCPRPPNSSAPPRSPPRPRARPPTSPCSATSTSSSRTAETPSSCTASRAAAGSRWAIRSVRPRREGSSPGASRSSRIGMADARRSTRSGPRISRSTSISGFRCASSARRRACASRSSRWRAVGAPSCATPATGWSARAAASRSSRRIASHRCSTRRRRSRTRGWRTRRRARSASRSDVSTAGTSAACRSRRSGGTSACSPSRTSGLAAPRRSSRST